MYNILASNYIYYYKCYCEVLYPDTNATDEDLYYGADCQQKCNCANDDCNRSPSLSNQDIGCTSGSTCSTGFTGDKCLEPTTCPSGFFGVLCNFPCHCKDSEDCNRDGSCANGCREAWAGPRCSIALPYRSEPPTVVNQTATTLTFYVTWTVGEDYGTGTITKRKLFYKSSQMDSFISITEKPDNNVVFVINEIIPNTEIQFYSQLSRMVGGGIEVDGPRSAIGSTSIICTKPIGEPEIELEKVEDYRIILSVKPVSSEYDHVQCRILRYQVRYSDVDGNVQGLVSTSSSQLEVEFSELSSCTDYVINARVVNNLDIAGSWGQDLTVQTAPSEASIESNPFTNGTHLLIKWKASTCDIPDYQVTYHYELSGDGVSRQVITTETEVVFGKDTESCKEYTFTVLATYLSVNGTSDSKKVVFGTDCANQGNSNQTEGYVISFVIGSIISSVITVAFTLILQRFRRKHLEKDVGKSTQPSTQHNVCTIDTDYQTLSKKCEESAYDDINLTVATSSTEHVYANLKPPLAEHVYGHTKTTYSY
ncbi:uncharacterized protein [Antedon mediterranea]|uniref:uncharacterized protein n=1 Tax=Antedon mediterranea TaxID=105859 RepID=UPI003AF851FB